MTVKVHLKIGITRKVEMTSKVFWILIITTRYSDENRTSKRDWKR